MTKTFERMPLISIHEVSPSGAISLVAANVPYGNLQWTRRFSTVGEFSVSLLCPCPVRVPGRYLLTASGHDEVGIIEKFEPSESDRGASCSLSGRFAECIWDRYQLGEGESARGANWRQAVTAAMSAWHMPDIPDLVMRGGTEGAGGDSHVVSGDRGSSAMEAIYSTAYANGHAPLVSYDRDRDASSLSVSLFEGRDLTREQDSNPVWVFSLGMATSSGISGSADYSVARSTVVASVDVERGGAAHSISLDVPVPGFDAGAMWMGRVFEDVSSLVGDDETPTDQLVSELGGLRSYDHMPEVSIDCSVMPSGYRASWDLGDLVEVELPTAGLVARHRIEEVREVHKPQGAYIETSVGTKTVSRIKRAMAGRR